MHRSGHRHPVVPDLGVQGRIGGWRSSDGWADRAVLLLLCAGLVAFFTASAWLIRRDMEQRFRRLGTQLEEEAFAVFQNIPDDPPCPSGRGGLALNDQSACRGQAVVVLIA